MNQPLCQIRPSPFMQSRRCFPAMLLALTASLGCGQQAGPGPSTKPADSKLPLYELKMDPKDLRAMERNPDSDNTHPANLVVEEIGRASCRERVAISVVACSFKIKKNQSCSPGFSSQK